MDNVHKCGSRDALGALLSILCVGHPASTQFELDIVDHLDVSWPKSQPFQHKLTLLLRPPGMITQGHLEADVKIAAHVRKGWLASMSMQQFKAESKRTGGHSEAFLVYMETHDALRPVSKQ